jgi:hypothetical protein
MQAPIRTRQAQQTRFAVWRLVAPLLIVSLLFAAIPLATATADEDAVAPAAADQAEPPAPVADLQVPYMQTASVDDGDLQLTLVAVDEDSRCPKEMLCVWQGRARIRLQATLNGADQGQIAMTTTVIQGRGPSTADVAVGPYTLRLVGMTPYPSVNQKPTPDQYVALLRLTRA